MVSTTLRKAAVTMSNRSKNKDRAGDPVKGRGVALPSTVEDQPGPSICEGNKMQAGWVKLWRKTMGSVAWGDPHLWQVWSWCLMRASHKARTVPQPCGKGVEFIDIKPGQFVTGRYSAEREIGFDNSKIRRRLLTLEKAHQITIQPTRHYSIITVVNWAFYQQGIADSGESEAGKAGESGLPTDTAGDTAPDAPTIHRRPRTRMSRTSKKDRSKDGKHCPTPSGVDDISGIEEIIG